MTSVPRAVDGFRTDLTSFVGRRNELADIRRSLGATRLLTLTGHGGVGKTRLAVRAAAAVERSFADGVRLVDLGEVADPARLEATVRAALGVSGEPHEPGGDLEGFVASAHLLVILDNCEHLLDACAALVQRLLSASRVLHVLATSRQPMGLACERTMSLSPLAVPRLSRPRPEILDQYDAVTLFVDRARAACPGFTVTDDNCALIVRLCRQLDGLPLAIELAAARLRAFSLPQLVELTGDRFALLTTGNRAGPARQRSLRSLLDWSHDRCTGLERTLWSRLSVFTGGFDRQAAERVCAAGSLDAAAVADGLEALVDKSVLTRTEQDGRARFQQLETVRQYGQLRLADAGEQATYRHRHMRWCRRQVAGTDRPEDAQLLAALEFSLGEGDDAVCAVDLAQTLCAHRWAYGAPGEGSRWLEKALRRLPRPTSARAKALWQRAWLALLQGDTTTARPMLDECRHIAEMIGDHDALAYATQFDGLAALHSGDPEGAVPQLAAAVDQHRRLGNDTSTAQTHLLEALCFAGDPSAREAVHGARVAIADQTPSVAHAALSWYEAVVEVVSGDPRAAAAPAAEALRSGERRLTSLCLETIAWSAAAGDDYQRAARLLGAAATARTEIGVELPGLGHVHRHHDAAACRARRGLGEEPFESAHRIGARMTAEQAETLAAGHAPAVPQPRRESSGPSPLTRREREIAKLVAAGLGNKEIAGRLVIAQRTAETHVGHILAKLGFTSRSQIAAWVSEHAAQPVT